jgi:hypothetical protein
MLPPGDCGTNDGSLTSGDGQKKVSRHRFGISRCSRDPLPKVLVEEVPPHPRCFCARVCKVMMVKKLVFCKVQKSVELHENKEVEFFREGLSTAGVGLGAVFPSSRSGVWSVELAQDLEKPSRARKTLRAAWNIRHAITRDTKCQQQLHIYLAAIRMDALIRMDQAIRIESTGEEVSNEARRSNAPAPLQTEGCGARRRLKVPLCSAHPAISFPAG